jgi:hypothetical protein
VDYTDENQFGVGQNMQESFIGRGDIRSYEDFEKTTEQLWQEGMEVLNMYLERLSKAAIPELKSHKRKIEWSWDDDGSGEFDPDRAAQGLPPWRKSTREQNTGPTEVTIITDSTAQWSMDSTDILWRGAAALAMTKLLEDKGYKVELWVASGSTLFMGRPYGVVLACNLKRCQDPLDMSTLVNTVSGWYYRTGTFACMRTICLKCNERIADGLGTVYSPRGGDLDEISQDELRIYSSGVFTFNGALNMILAEVNKFQTKGESDAKT